MNWRTAFLRQARSEQQVRHLLNHPSVPTCHRLHYLQMVTEKLAKGFLTRPGDHDPPPPTHHAFVRLLQVIKGSPDIRRELGYADVGSFRAYIDSLLPLAAQIERLAPTAAGQALPNPEYPWRDPATDDVMAPADFDFPLFDPRDPKMIKLEKLVDSIVRIAE